MTLAKPSSEPDWQDYREGPHASEITSAREAYETAFLRLPRWVTLALRLRNAIVGRLGLRTDAPEAEGKALMLHLPVAEETPQRYEVGLVDRHLTFTITTDLREGRARMTTSIWFNHWTGRAYLAVVYIPHKIITALAIRRLA